MLRDLYVVHVISQLFPHHVGRDTQPMPNHIPHVHDLQEVR